MVCALQLPLTPTQLRKQDQFEQGSSLFMYKPLLSNTVATSHCGYLNLNPLTTTAINNSVPHLHFHIANVCQPHWGVCFRLLFLPSCWGASVSAYGLSRRIQGQIGFMNATCYVLPGISKMHHSILNNIPNRKLHLILFKEQFPKL